MEPGFAIRFDEEWERTFNKKKVRNSAKKWAHAMGLELEPT
jgi:hypothetical protein